MVTDEDWHDAGLVLFEVTEVEDESSAEKRTVNSDNQSDGWIMVSFPSCGGELSISKQATSASRKQTRLLLKSGIHSRAFLTHLVCQLKESYFEQQIVAGWWFAPFKWRSILHVEQTFADTIS